MGGGGDLPTRDLVLVNSLLRNVCWGFYQTKKAPDHGWVPPESEPLPLAFYSSGISHITHTRSLSLFGGNPTIENKGEREKLGNGKELGGSKCANL